MKRGEERQGKRGGGAEGGEGVCGVMAAPGGWGNSGAWDYVHDRE